MTKSANKTPQPEGEQNTPRVPDYDELINRISQVSRDIDESNQEFNNQKHAFSRWERKRAELGNTVRLLFQDTVSIKARVLTPTEAGIVLGIIQKAKTADWKLPKEIDAISEKLAQPDPVKMGGSGE